MLSFLQATGKFIRSRSRSDVLARLSRQWRYMNSELLPETYLVDLFPEIEGQKIEMSVDINHPFELPYGERSVLGAIAALLEPKTVFEFGTYSGSTTTLLAEACGESTLVHTLDLPDERLREAGIDPDTIGHYIRKQPRLESRITQHRQDSRVFDFSPFSGKVDLVYVDGSHEFDDVLRDSRTALKMLTPGGTIVWDDYQVACMQVAEAIDVLAGEMAICRMKSTRLAVHRSV